MQPCAKQPLPRQQPARYTKNLPRCLTREVAEATGNCEFGEAAANVVSREVGSDESVVRGLVGAAESVKVGGGSDNQRAAGDVGCWCSSRSALEIAFPTAEVEATAAVAAIGPTSHAAAPTAAATVSAAAPSTVVAASETRLVGSGLERSSSRPRRSCSRNVRYQAPSLYCMLNTKRVWHRVE